ncbi:hypothetical protein GXW83_06075 [Streptacidiphilus sp. PB12-B1b]|uniref:hypothetical protein n=1 Tax=Streptacidiphilus sp. PB12-B1b TaxID=2705012 RepID=UPI0015FDE6FA|nr:hypothetical protein [Streptacidiphilus sp. PB12-B1b]QMU75381.1 hypothetical protein GXW83_06075 [Streptacidiphilus sp. PB12-B1b]
MSSRTDEQAERSRDRSGRRPPGPGTGARAAFTAAAVAAVLAAGGAPAFAAATGPDAPAPQPAAHPAARTAALPGGGHTVTTLVTAGGPAAAPAPGAGAAAGTGADAVALPGAGPVVDVIMVAPATTRPGGTVDLRTFADCGGGAGTVISAALAAPAPLAMAADGGLFAQGAVARGAQPGDYAVLETCRGRTVAAGTMTVRALGAPAAGGGWGATRLAGSGLGPSGLAAGLGSAFGLDDARPTGELPSRAEQYASLGLIGAAVAAAVLFTCQRRRALRRG